MTERVYPQPVVSCTHPGIVTRRKVPASNGSAMIASPQVRDSWGWAERAAAAGKSQRRSGGRRCLAHSRASGGRIGDPRAGAVRPDFESQSAHAAHRLDQTGPADSRRIV